MRGYVTKYVTKARVSGGPLLYVIERIGRRGWTRTSDHLLRRQVLYPPELRARVSSLLILKYLAGPWLR